MQCSRGNEILDRNLNIATNLTEQAGRDVPSCVHRNRGGSAIGVPKLNV